MIEKWFSTNCHLKDPMSTFLAADGAKHLILSVLVTKLSELPLKLERTSRTSRLAIELVLVLSRVLAWNLLVRNVSPSHQI